jgi:hypothetical protein
MLVLLECQVENGLRPQEATVMVKDFHGQTEFMPLDRGMLEHGGEKRYVPVALIHVDTRNKAALVGLPIEADSGAHRIWVKVQDLKGLPASSRGRGPCLLPPRSLPANARSGLAELMRPRGTRMI